jgi:hypothetical protein
MRTTFPKRLASRDRPESTGSGPCNFHGQSLAVGRGVRLALRSIPGSAKALGGLTVISPGLLAGEPGPDQGEPAAVRAAEVTWNDSLNSALNLRIKTNEFAFRISRLEY